MEKARYIAENGYIAKKQQEMLLNEIEVLKKDNNSENGTYLERLFLDVLNTKHRLDCLNGDRKEALDDRSIRNILDIIFQKTTNKLEAEKIITYIIDTVLIDS